LLKSYVYISDSKVDMLYPQIPQNFLSKIAAELKINLGVLNLTVGHQRAEKNRQDKLNLIIRYLKEEGAVGTVDSPKKYFEGVLPMRWRPFGEGNLVYFGGSTESCVPRTVLGLGGSMHHLIGELRGESMVHSGSLARSIIAILAKLAEDEDPEWARKIRQSRWQRPLTREEEESLILSAVSSSTSNLSGPTENLEFVAKRLVDVSGRLRRGYGETPFDIIYDPSTTHAVLGTPIYVAQAD
jgi:hypothetical protein